MVPTPWMRPHAPATTGWKLVMLFSMHALPPKAEVNEPAMNWPLEYVTSAGVTTLSPLGMLEDAWIIVTVCWCSSCSMCALGGGITRMGVYYLALDNVGHGLQRWQDPVLCSQLANSNQWLCNIVAQERGHQGGDTVVAQACGTCHVRYAQRGQGHCLYPRHGFQVIRQLLVHV